MTRPTNTTAQFQINPSDISSVYSGKDGKCCCGCAGKHTYASATREAAGKHRGYPITDDEVNNATVRLIVSKMNAAGPEEDGNHYHVTVGSRLYIAYKAEGK